MTIIWADEFANWQSKLRNKAIQEMTEYIERHGTADKQALIDYAYAISQKYAEGAAELACQMYDDIAQACGVSVPPAEPAEPAGYEETARMVEATQQSPSMLQGGVGRLVKQAGADTTLKNAVRDGAEWAWVPRGDTCPFCIALASRGWQKASAKALKGGHAQHIHANCDCEYIIRHNGDTTVAGYDPDKYLAQYNAAGGDINAMRRAQYAENKDIINAQKRAAYAARQKEKNGLENVLAEYNRTANPGQGIITYDDGYDLVRHKDEIKIAQWLHEHFGGDIELINEDRGYKVLTPDYLWRGKLWDLKTVTTEKSANSAVRHGLKQTLKNPGGVILDYGENDISLQGLETILQRRLAASAKATVDIIVLRKGECVAVLRYKK